MATKNWREPNNAGAKKRPKKKQRSVKQSSRQTPLLRTAIRSIAFLATLFVLAVAGRLIVDYTRSLEKTTLFLLNQPLESADEEVPPITIDVTSRFSSESYSQLRSPKKHVVCASVDQWDEKIKLGPQKNTVLYYLGGDAVIDQKNQIWISKNLQNGSKTEEEGWINIAEQIKQICGHQPKSNTDAPLNRVLFLDIGRIESNAIADSKQNELSKKLSKLLVQLNEDVEHSPELDRFWLISSVGDDQKSWFSPELNSSVFSYFLGLGLNGHAAVPDEGVITLKDLFSYIENSVNRWTLDHRYSAQSPQLISLSEIEHDKVPIIYSKKTPTPLQGVFQIPGNNNSKLNALWSKFNQQKNTKAFAFRPHYRWRIESLLTEMESTRYATENDSKGKRLFDRLHSKANELLDAIPLPSTSPNVKLSVEQFLNRNPNYDSNLPAFKNLLYSATTSSPESAEPEQAALKEPAFLKQMQRIDRVDFIWRYLSSNEISNDPITRETLSRCLHLITSAAPAENTTTPTDLLEVGFLRLLKENINWRETNDLSAKQQLQTALEAIRCRRISERLIQGRFTVGGTDRIVEAARYWLPIRIKHQELDERRRRAEDLLLANNADASSQFIDLLVEYNALEQKAVSIFQANTIARETLQISSYLKSFWENEARLISSSERSKIAAKALLQLAEARRIACEIIAPDQTHGDLVTQRNSLIAINQKLGKTLKEQYYNNLSNVQNSASDVIFHAIQLLESPIPEWSVAGMSREKLRNNLDRWLGEQSDSLKGDYSDPLKPMKSESKSKDEIANPDLWSNPVPPQYSLLKKLGTPSALDYSVIITALQEGGEFFEDHFNKANSNITNIADLIKIYDELTALDLEMVCGHDLLSRLDFNLDVGAYLDLIAQFIQIRDQFERNKCDCWGDGDVTDLDQTPFLIYGNILAEKYETQLEKLKDYGTEEREFQCHLELKPLQKVVDSSISKLLENWQELSRTALEWNGDAKKLEFENDLVVATKMNSQFAPRDVGEDNSPLVMKSEIRLTTTIGNPNPLEFNFDQKQKLTPSVQFTEQELSKKVAIESVVSFRGHLFKKRSIFLKTPTKKVTLVTYKFGQKMTSPGSPTIKVIDATPMQADIIFILDCSESMIKKDPTRFQNAQAALIQSLENLLETRRFRFSLYGFGHRNGFITDDTDDKNEYVETQSDPPKYRVSNNNPDIPHPLEDCQQIFAMEGNKAAITTKEEVENLKLKIMALQPQGVTPLFFSIKDALEKEFSTERPKNRRRLIVVLSDGKNTDPSGFTNSLYYTPPGQTVSDLTKPNDVKKLIDSSGAELIIARIYGKNRDQITKEEEKGLIDSGTLPDNILKIDDSNATEISKRILQAIGTSRFAVTPEGEETGQTTYALGKKIKRPAGNYIVNTVGVTKDDDFLVELYNDVSVILKNTNEGLILDGGIPPRFLQDVTCQLGSARYQIGLISKKPNSLAFGFKKNKDVTGGNSPNFSFRPQRIWLQLTEVNSKRVHNLFLPSYSTGIHPIAEFELPDKLDSGMIDICLWITPNVNDGYPPLQTTGRELELGSTMVEQLRVSLKKIEDEENLYEVTATPESDDERAIFVGCSNFDAWNRTQNFKVNNLLNETFRYRVTTDDVRFNFHALPGEQYQKILDDVKNAPGKFGKSRDPIFGCKDATWIKLKGVRLTK